MKLIGKNALITGGNSGIGFATAKLFIEEGAEVAITGRNQETLNEAVQSLGSKASAYRADVSNSDDRKRLFENLATHFGKLDIVFANAGIGGQTVAGSTTEEEFENIIRVNLTGVFFTVNSASSAQRWRFRHFERLSNRYPWAAWVLSLRCQQGWRSRTRPHTRGRPG